MSLSAIVAISQNNVIGRNNALPWHLPEDLKHFKKTTLGHAVVMGRRTFDSINRKPLPNRPNFVVTRDPAFKAEGVTVIHDFRSWLERLPKDEEIFLLGGSELFKAAWPWVDKLYLTLIEKDFEGDTFFPMQDPLEGFRVVSDTGSLTAQNGLPYRIITAERVNR